MPRHRLRGNCLFLYVEDADAPGGMRKVRPLSFDAGEAGVERMQFDHVRSDAHKLIGYIARSSKVRAQAEARSSNRTDPAAITARESQANAGTMGKSRTAHLGQDRPPRVHQKSGRALPVEDFVERTANKIAAYVHSANFRTGDRAVRVYPKVVSGAKS